MRKYVLIFSLLIVFAFVNPVFTADGFCYAPLTSMHQYEAPTLIFAGTLLTIENYSDTARLMTFEIEKTWKGIPETEMIVNKDAILTNCPIFEGKNYLLYFNGEEDRRFMLPMIKSFENAQNDIMLLEDVEKLKVISESYAILDQKLEEAKEKLSLVMIKQDPSFPISSLMVDTLSHTLHVGLNPYNSDVSPEEYVQKVRQVIGDLPVKIGLVYVIEEGQETNSVNPIKIHSIPSPLKQIKAGIMSNVVQCKEGLELIFKPDGISPACVTPQTFGKLIERGWVIPILGNLS